MTQTPRVSLATGYNEGQFRRFRKVGWGCPALVVLTLTIPFLNAGYGQENFLEQLTSEQRNVLVEALTEYEAGQRAFASNNFEKAVSHVEKMISLSAQVLGRDHGSMAGKYADLSVMYLRWGKPDEAIRCAREALRLNARDLPGEHPLIAFNKRGLGMALLEAGRVAEALQELLDSQAIAQVALADSPLDYSYFLNDLAYCYAKQFQATKAIELYQQALAIREKSPSCPPLALATSLNNLGEQQMQAGEYALARINLERALEICEAKVGVNAMTATTLNNLGILFRFQGNYPEALKAYNQAYDMRRKLLPAEHPDLGRSLANRGAVLMKMKRFDEAFEDLVNSREILAAALGETHPDMSNLVNLQGELFQTIGQPAQAHALAVESLNIRRAVYGPENPTVGAAFFDVGVASLQAGYLPAAQLYFSEAIGITQRTLGENDVSLAKMHEHMAELQAQLGDPETACQHFHQGQRIIRQHAMKVLPSLSPVDQGTYRNLFNRRIRAALSFGLRHAGREANALAIEWLLNNKAILHESLGQQTQLQFLSTDSDTARRLREVREELSRLSMHSATAQASEEQADVAAQLQAEEGRLARELAVQTGLREPAAWISLPQIRQRLPKTSVLIEFVRLEPTYFDFQALALVTEPARYVAWIVLPDGQNESEESLPVDLGPAAEIDQLIVATRQQILDDSQLISEDKGFDELKLTKSLQLKLQELAERIYRPLANRLNSVPEHVFLSPDSNLWLVPWAALVVDEQQRYLVEACSLSFLSSGRELLRDLPQGGTSQAPVIFANPNFNLPPEEQPRWNPGRPRMVIERSLERRLAPAPALPATEIEALRIQPNLATFAEAQPVLFSGDQAIESQVKQVSQPKVLVFSTHGFFLEDPAPLTEPEPMGNRVDQVKSALDNPFLRCGLLLAGCNEQVAPEVDDGVLTGAEVLGLDLRGTRLVVLSACETGLGTVQVGEGVAGLRQAFLLAGAQAVVSSLWSVPDLETAAVIDGMFEEMSRERSGAAALRSAQRKRIERRRQIYGAAHPYFWAALTYTGL